MEVVRGCQGLLEVVRGCQGLMEDVIGCQGLLEVVEIIGVCKRVLEAVLWCLQDVEFH